MNNYRSVPARNQPHLRSRREHGNGLATHGESLKTTSTERGTRLEFTWPEKTRETTTQLEKNKTRKHWEDLK